VPSLLQVAPAEEFEGLLGNMASQKTGQGNLLALVAGETKMKLSYDQVR
jgi:hypothetical protein